MKTKSKAHTDSVIDEIRRLYRNGTIAKDLAEKYYVHPNTIYNYCKGIRKRGV